jgi:hypothetical protein
LIELGHALDLLNVLFSRRLSTGERACVGFKNLYEIIGDDSNMMTHISHVSFKFALVKRGRGSEKKVDSEQCTPSKTFCRQQILTTFETNSLQLPLSDSSVDAYLSLLLQESAPRSDVADSLAKSRSARSSLPADRCSQA